MATLYITFTEPSPAPSQYKVRYKQTTDSTWTEVTLPSPPPFTISGTTSGVEYDVEVYSDCGGGVFSLPDTDVAAFDDCQEYSFNNSSGVDQTLTYYPCGDPAGDSITITMANGDVEGPFCISNGNGAYSNPEGGLGVSAGSPCVPS
jgi:hypothetical protein